MVWHVGPSDQGCAFLDTLLTEADTVCQEPCNHTMSGASASLQSMPCSFAYQIIMTTTDSISIPRRGIRSGNACRCTTAQYTVLLRMQMVWPERQHLNTVHLLKLGQPAHYLWNSPKC